MEEKLSSISLPASRDSVTEGARRENDLGSAANRGCRDELILQHGTEEEGGEVRKPGDDSLQGARRKSDLRTPLWPAVFTFTITLAPWKSGAWMESTKGRDRTSYCPQPVSYRRKTIPASAAA